MKNEIVTSAKNNCAPLLERLFGKLILRQSLENYYRTEYFRIVQKDGMLPI